MTTLTALTHCRKAILTLEFFFSKFIGEGKSNVLFALASLRGPLPRADVEVWTSLTVPQATWSVNGISCHGRCWLEYVMKRLLTSPTCPSHLPPVHHGFQPQTESMNVCRLGGYLSSYFSSSAAIDVYFIRDPNHRTTPPPLPWHSSKKLA